MNLLRRPPSAGLVAAVAVIGLLAAGCSNESDPDLAPVLQAVDALDSAQADLRARITELESALSAVATGGGETDAPATGLLDQLTELQTLLDELDNKLDQEVLDRGDAIAGLQGSIANIQDLLADIDRDVADLTAAVQTLREDHELLVARFERHVADHS